MFRRTQITQVYYQYMKTQLLPQLEHLGFDVQMLVSGDEYDFSAFEPFENKRIRFMETENNLGMKKNKMLKESLDCNADYVLLIDSDDFVHLNTVVRLLNLAHSNMYWASIENFGFFNTATRTFSEFKGYSKSHCLYKNGMGSCRVFSRLLIDFLGARPFKEDVNRSMDASIKAKLVSLEIPYEQRLLTEKEFLPIGLKSSENIWPISAYKTEPLHTTDTKVSWFPFTNILV